MLAYSCDDVSFGGIVLVLVWPLYMGGGGILSSVCDVHDRENITTGVPNPLYLASRGDQFVPRIHDKENRQFIGK